WALVGGTGGHRWVALVGWHRWVALLGTGGCIAGHRWVHCWAQVGALLGTGGVQGALLGTGGRNVCVALIIRALMIIDPDDRCRSLL
ncbi:unnamed protein product, partial [Staurois parvus]